MKKNQKEEETMIRINRRNAEAAARVKTYTDYRRLVDDIPRLGIHPPRLRRMGIRLNSN